MTGYDTGLRGYLKQLRRHLDDVLAVLVFLLGVERSTSHHHLHTLLLSLGFLVCHDDVRRCWATPALGR